MRFRALNWKRTSGREPAEELREIARGLEAELESVQVQSSVKQAEARAVEAQVMTAIRQANDGTAHALILEHGRLVAEIAELDADDRVLQSLLDEIREFLNARSSA